LDRVVIQADDDVPQQDTAFFRRAVAFDRHNHQANFLVKLFG
jgi:hypothetical protein